MKRCNTPDLSALRQSYKFLMALGIILLLIMIALISISGYFASRMVKCDRIPVQENPGNLGLKYENVSFPSSIDKLTIRGWYLPANGSNRCIIMAHGGEGHRADPTIGMLKIG